MSDEQRCGVHDERRARAKCSCSEIVRALRAKQEPPGFLIPPFEVYEDYEGGYHIIDATTRIVLSDSYAYDADKATTINRMETLARALSVAYAASIFEPQMDVVRALNAAQRAIPSKDVISLRTIDAMRAAAERKR